MLLFFLLCLSLITLSFTLYWLDMTYCSDGTSQVALVVNIPSTNTGGIKGSGLMPGSGRSPGGRNGNPLQYSCLDNSMDRGAWWAAAHGVTESQTSLSTQHKTSREPGCFHWDRIPHITRCPRKTA